MANVTLLVEAIGGPKMAVEVDRSASVEDIAIAAAAATGRSLTDDDGAPRKWRLFTPTARGGFAPASPDLDLAPIVSAMEALRDSGGEGGFAGPGEHDGTAYLFRVRLFVLQPVEPVSVEEAPPPIDDEEAIDLTNLSEEHDELETVRTVRTHSRKRSHGGTKKRRRRRPSQGANAEEHGPKAGGGADEPPSEDEPSDAPGEDRAGDEQEGRAPSTTVPAEPPDGDGETPVAAPPRPEETAHKSLVAAPALAARTPVPGDTALTAPLPKEEAARPVPKKARSTGIPKKARSTGIPKKARSTGIPKKARSTGIPKKARSTGIPKKARSTGIPKKARSTGIPKKARSTGIPKKARSTGIPKKARSTGIPGGAAGTVGGKQRAKKGGGGVMGLLAALLVLGGVTAAFFVVFTNKDPPPAPTPPPTDPPASRLADQIRIEPYPTDEAPAEGDPVRAALREFNAIGARSGDDLRDPGRFEAASKSAATLRQICTTTHRFDGCDAASRTAFAAYLGCVGTGCPTDEAGQWFIRAADMEARALDALVTLEDRAVRGEALKLVALQSVRLGGQSMRVLAAKAPRLAKLASTSCEAEAMATRPDCRGVLAD